MNTCRPSLHLLRRAPRTQHYTWHTSRAGSKMFSTRPSLHSIAALHYPVHAGIASQRVYFCSSADQTTGRIRESISETAERELEEDDESEVWGEAKPHDHTSNATTSLPRGESATGTKKQKSKASSVSFGVVRKWWDHKGFGFIQDEETGKDIFVQRSDLVVEAGGYKSLFRQVTSADSNSVDSKAELQKVMFVKGEDGAKGDGRLKAYRVLAADGSPLPSGPQECPRAREKPSSWAPLDGPSWPRK